MKWWLARRGYIFPVLVLLFVGTACQQTPQPWVDNGVCVYSNKPLECHFVIHNPGEATQSFKWALTISNPTQIEVTPVTSGTLPPGASITIQAVIHSCPFTITVIDTGQQTKPGIYTVHMPAGGCGTSAYSAR